MKQQIVVPKELSEHEQRVAATPETVKKLIKLGASVAVQTQLGEDIGANDELYKEAGAVIIASREELLESADVVLSVGRLDLTDLQHLKPDTTCISFMDPFNDIAYIDALNEAKVAGISVEMIPRSTRSQKMDALSSQANLAGYVMALKAAATLPRIFPMMMTPGGTIKPAKVFIIGAGVAGLQAIATARRLGAQVIAFDTRAVVAEQVESLGAKFLKIDLGETGQTKDGYAQALTAEQQEIQKAAQAATIADSDVVITTAQLFGRKPPLIITEEQVKSMRPGSVIVDMAAENGGNVAGSIAGSTTVVNGVRIIGDGYWPNAVNVDASAMYANNLYNLVDEFWNKEQQQFEADFENDLSPCWITYQGHIKNAVIQEHLSQEK